MPPALPQMRCLSTAAAMGMPSSSEMPVTSSKRCLCCSTGHASTIEQVSDNHKQSFFNFVNGMLGMHFAAYLVPALLPDFLICFLLVLPCTSGRLGTLVGSTEGKAMHCDDHLQVVWSGFATQLVCLFFLRET